MQEYVAIDGNQMKTGFRDDVKNGGILSYLPAISLARPKNRNKQDERIRCNRRLLTENRFSRRRKKGGNFLIFANKNRQTGQIIHTYLKPGPTNSEGIKALFSEKCTNRQSELLRKMPL